MSWLVLHDSKQGHSGQIGLMIEELSRRLKDRVTGYDISEGIVYPDDLKGIVLWCCLRWYLGNRTAIKGRPWVAAMSWCFDDLMSIIASPDHFGTNIIDAGVNALWTNCSVYVEHISAAYQCHFSFKPWQVSPWHSSRYQIGAVVENVADRDFSQLLLTAQLLSKEADAAQPRLFVRAEELGDLPSEIVDTMGAHIHAIEDPYVLSRSYQQLRYLVLTPRITDLRGGVLPPEIGQSAQAECTPLVIRHPVWRPYLADESMIRSLKQYRELVTRICHGESVTLKMPAAQLCSTYRYLTSSVARAHNEYIDTTTRVVQN